MKPGSGEGSASLQVRLIDFGSAIDEHSMRHLYGAEGPSVNEQTMEYAPPEALLGRCCYTLSLFFFMRVNRGPCFRLL